MPGWLTFPAFVQEAEQAPPDQRPALVRALLDEHPTWPWVQTTRATFIYQGQAQRVALNLDTITSDPPFAPMARLDGTDLWYVTRRLASDDLLDYLFAVDDPMTPLRDDPRLAERIAAHWKADPLNPAVMSTVMMDVSVLRMPQARPFPDWRAMPRVPRGGTHQHTLDTPQLSTPTRQVWVHTPPGYDSSGTMHPLLVLHDGGWMTGPLQAAHIADALVKHGRMEPTVLAMVESAPAQQRVREYADADATYAFIRDGLLPFLQTHYRVDSTRMGIGGVSAGAAAAAGVALANPAVFNALLMISPPLGTGEAGVALQALRAQLGEARVLPTRVFQAVGRYEDGNRFLGPGRALAEALAARAAHGALQHRFVMLGSGHGMVAFRSVLPEAFAFLMPGAAG